MPFLLVILGLCLILLEFYLPGAVMGILGGVSIVTAIILFASQTSSLVAVVLFVLGTVVCVGLLIRFALWRIVHAKPQYSIYSDQSQEGYQASTYDQSAIGKTGLVVADLKPGGYIVIGGHQHPAISLEGYVTKGEHVIVVSGQEQSLIVKKKELTI